MRLLPFAAAGGGAAEGGPVADQVPDGLGDDVHAGPLAGGDHRHGGGHRWVMSSTTRVFRVSLVLVQLSEQDKQGSMPNDLALGTKPIRSRPIT